jgi:hypothetical protein
LFIDIRGVENAAGRGLYHPAIASAIVEARKTEKKRLISNFNGFLEKASSKHPSMFVVICVATLTDRRVHSSSAR